MRRGREAGEKGPREERKRTSGDGAATGDGVKSLNGHQEGLVGLSLGLRELVDGGEELPDRLNTVLGVLELDGLEGGTVDDGGGVAVVLVSGQLLADLHGHHVLELLVGDKVALVEPHDDVLDADLPGEQNVLTGLGHGASGAVHHKDGTVGQRGTCKGTTGNFVWGGGGAAHRYFKKKGRGYQ